jgi:hypothetical protein
MTLACPPSRVHRSGDDGGVARARDTPSRGRPDELRVGSTRHRHRGFDQESGERGRRSRSRGEPGRGVEFPSVHGSHSRSSALALTRGIVRERLETDQTRCHLTLVTPYGPFARLADGVEGLIHVTAPGGRKAPSVCSCRRAHMNRCPVGGRVRTRTYNRNQMMPALIYGPEEL